MAAEVRTACGSGRFFASHCGPSRSEINRPLPQAVSDNVHFGPGEVKLAPQH